MKKLEIIQAVKSGKKVHWVNGLYIIEKWKTGEFVITCTANNHSIGLTWTDETTLNGKESEFYISTP